jgi:hypothetical protein
MGRCNTLYSKQIDRRWCVCDQDLREFRKNNGLRHGVAGSTARVGRIGRAPGFDHGSIRTLLIQKGGIAPPPRKRARSALTLTEREDVSRGIASGATFRTIAARLGRAPSTVSREVARHGGAIGIALLERMIAPGGSHCAPRSACSHGTESCATSRE